MLAARRQRRRCRARHRDHAHRRRAVQQRHRFAISSRSCGTGDELVGLNASGRAPAAWSPKRFAGRQRDARARLGKRDDSGRGVGLGGAVAALRQASVRRPFRAPPIRYARDGWRGVAGGRRTNGHWRVAAYAATSSGWPEHFMPRRARAASRRALRVPRDGAIRWNEIAATRGRAFYRGELARSHGERMRRRTGVRTRSRDFAAHDARLG